MTILCLLILLVHSSFTATKADPLFNACEGGSYAKNSNFRSNLVRLLAYFSSVNSTFATHVSDGTDPAFGLILCRGDVGPSDCSACIGDAARDVLSLCPNSKRATVWYDYCELRYSDFRFFSTVDMGFQAPILINVQSATDHLDDFIKVEGRLLDRLVRRAAYHSPLLFATGSAALAGSDGRMNALAQCTRDLSRDGCSRCLSKIRRSYRGYEARKGGRVLDQSCNFRYEVYSFYQGD